MSADYLSVPNVTEHHVPEIIENSRKNYCVLRSEVEKMLARWDEAGEFEESGPQEVPEFEEPLI